MYTYTNHKQREHSNSGSFLIGFEKAVSFYSSFMTLHPGDIIHMGAGKIDGVYTDKDIMNLTSNNSVVGGEIEGCGKLSAYISHEFDKEKTKSLMPILHDITNKHYFTETFMNKSYYFCFNNDKENKDILLNKENQVLPCPTSALTFNSNSYLSSKTIKFRVFPSLAYSIGEKNSINSFFPMLNIQDLTIKELFIHPEIEENTIGEFYGLWGDGYQTLCNSIPDYMNHIIKMEINNETIEINTSNYLFNPAQTSLFINNYITLLPGDIINLGMLNEKFITVLPEENEEIEVKLYLDDSLILTKHIRPYSAKMTT